MMRAKQRLDTLWRETQTCKYALYVLHATDCELCSPCQDSQFRSFQGLEDGRSNKYTRFSSKHLIAFTNVLWFFSQWIQRKAEFLESSEWLLISSA